MSEVKKQSKVERTKKEKSTDKKVKAAAKKEPKKTVTKKVKSEEKKQTKVEKNKKEKSADKKVKAAAKKEPKKLVAKKVKQNEVKEEKKVVAKISMPKIETKEKVTQDLKKEKNILNENEQKYFKALCRVVEILTKIAKICLMIFVPFIFLVMVLTPFIFKNFDISANIIKFNDVNIVVRDDGVSLKIGDSIKVLDCNTNEINRIVNFMSNNSKGTIIAFIELSLLLFGVIIVIDIYLLSYLEKLFANFVKKTTPFTKENTKYIFMIAVLMAAIKFINICLSAVNLFTYSINSHSLLDIIIVFAIYFAFKYATGIQKKVDTKIYD